MTVLKPAGFTVLMKKAYINLVADAVRAYLQEV